MTLNSRPFGDNHASAFVEAWIDGFSRAGIRMKVFFAMLDAQLAEIWISLMPLNWRGLLWVTETIFTWFNT